MIDKRLLKEMPQAKVMVWKQVFMQWLGMLSNIGMVFLFANIFVEMFQDTLTLRNLMLCAIGVILMIIVLSLIHILSCGFTAIIAGISEPSMFGVNLKYKTPLICVCIGNFFGAGLCGLLQVYCCLLYTSIYEYTPGFVHGKTFVVDDDMAVVGTVNMDYRSYYLHYECGVWFYRSKVVMDVKQDYLHSLAKSHEVTLEECKNVKLPVRIMRSILNLFSPMM